MRLLARAPALDEGMSFLHLLATGAFANRLLGATLPVLVMKEGLNAKGRVLVPGHFLLSLLLLGSSSSAKACESYLPVLDVLAESYRGPSAE